MKLSPLKYGMSSISGTLVIIIFCIFTFTAVALFPTDYSPINNWLSDLGNSSYNTQGFIFFNLGCILTGLLLFPFFLGLRKWYTDQKLQENLLKIGQSIGLFSSFALIMIGVFYEDYGILHWFWSALFFLSLLLVLIIVNMSLFLHPLYKKGVFYYGLAAAFVDLFFIMLYFVPNTLPRPLFEWLSVFVSLGWVGLIVYNMLNLNKYKNKK